MYTSLQSQNGNYQYLFNLTNAVGGDPEISSLFNIQTLKKLISLGDSTPNILKDTSQVYGTSFMLSGEWTDLTVALGLASEEQTYMMWLWLDTAYD